MTVSFVVTTIVNRSALASASSTKQSNYAYDDIDFILMRHSLSYIRSSYNARVLCTNTHTEVVNGMREFIGDVEHDSIAESKPDIQSMGEPYESLENSLFRP